MTLIFVATIFITSIFITPIFVATKLFAPFAGEKLAAAFTSGVVAGMIVAGKMVNAIADIGRTGVGLNLILVDLTFAHGGQVVGYGFFFVEADLAGVSAHKAFVEDAAGELFEVLVFEGAQHAGADFRGVGDGIEPDTGLLALLTKFFSERTQGRLRRTGQISVRIEME